jgi:hypothetical protein
MDQKPKNVNKFWMLYRDAVIGSGILEKTAEWYVHGAQKFAVSIKGKRLRSRSSDDVHRFLTCSNARMVQSNVRFTKVF